jgi:hypothetical protein
LGCNDADVLINNAIDDGSDDDDDDDDNINNNNNNNNNQQCPRLYVRVPACSLVAFVSWAPSGCNAMYLDVITCQFNHKEMQKNRTGIS